MKHQLKTLSPIGKRLFAPFRWLLSKLCPITYVKMQYRYYTGHRLNLKNPRRYTEKLQYLRLFVYPTMPLVSQCAGRIGVRDYLHELGLAKYLIPSYGIYDHYDEIDFDKLPDAFVIKCSHGCAFNSIITNKDHINQPLSKKKFTKWLKTDYGQTTLEPHYSKIKPQLLIEQYLGKQDELPIEYKIHVFNGVAKSLYVVTGRGEDIRYTNFYIDWTPFDGSQFNNWKKADYEIKKPAQFDEMVALAEQLAKPFPFVRVDLYCIDGKILFSELTFTPAKGTLKLDDDKVDDEMGAWLDITSYLNKK